MFKFRKFRSPIYLNPLLKMRIHYYWLKAIRKNVIKCTGRNAVLINAVFLLMFFLINIPAFASPYLVSDPHDQATCYEVRLIVGTPDDPSNIVDDKIFEFSAQADGSLKADLVNFPSGTNNLMVLACNVFGKSVEVSFTFEKFQPGISTNMALVNIDGIAYLVTDPQEGVIQYRIRIDGVDYFYDTEDGSLALDLSFLENGVHSVEIYAINIWGESNPAPFGFTKAIPAAPKNIRLTQ